VAKKLTQKQVAAEIDERLRSLCAAALADPQVDTGGKSLAGFWLERLTRDEAAREAILGPILGEEQEPAG
jgi:hypothetical protein